MASLQSSARLDVAYDKDFYGEVVYCGDDVMWPLVAQIGQPGVIVSNLQAEPTGNYLMQTPAYLQLDADETQWTTSGGTFTHTADPSNNRTGIWQSDGRLETGGSAIFNEPHSFDTFGGFKLDMFRGAPVQTPGGATVALTADSFNFRIYFTIDTPENAGPLLMLAVEAGRPIELRLSTDNGANYYPVATADALGDSETYLNTTGRRLVVEVMPQTDITWFTGLPQSQTVSDTPPNQIVVTINNGDAVLVWKSADAGFPAGQIEIDWQGGQWGSYVHLMQFQALCTMKLPAQYRTRSFQTQPVSDFSGYAPFDGFVDVAANVLAPKVVEALLTVAAPPENIDPATGNATCSVYLSFATLSFPKITRGPNTSVAYASFYDTGDGGVPTIADWRDLHQFDQRNFLVRSSASVIISDSLGVLRPGQSKAIGPFIRAAALVRGNVGLDNFGGNYEDLWPGITGLAPAGELTYDWTGKHFMLGVGIMSRFRDQRIVDYIRAMDGQCHYYVMRQLGYRMGLTDEWMTSFPYCNRDSPCDHYHLPRGTTFNPLFQFEPSMHILAAMLKVRAVAGEVDLATGQVLPMYLFLDMRGNLIYQAAPVGLVQTWLDPSLNPIQQGVDIIGAYSVVPEFTGGVPHLNEFVGEMGSSVSIDNIRTPIVLEGATPFGQIVTGTYRNPRLDDPDAWGYAGGDMPYYDISYLYSSPEAMAFALEIAAVQMSFPSIKTRFRAPLQPRLFPLQAISVQEPYTQGTASPVTYYTESVASWGTQTGNGLDSGTRAGCRILGQAGS